MNSAEFQRVYRTVDGPVHLRIQQESQGRWVARITGDELDCGLYENTQEAAIDAAEKAFRELFPEYELEV